MTRRCQPYYDVKIAERERRGKEEGLTDRGAKQNAKVVRFDKAPVMSSRR